MKPPSAALELQASRLPLYLHPPLPTVFTFEITARCQHACAGCGNVFTHSHMEMDITAWRKIIAKLRPHIHALRITGGEPTLHRQFRLFLKEIDRLKVPFVVFTNANWSHPEATIKLFQESVHLKGLLVSLHGSNPNTFAQFTGSNAFEKVVSNIQKATSAGLRVTTNTLLLSTTIDHLPEIANLAFAVGAANVSFGRYYGLPMNGLSPSELQFKHALSQIAALRRMDQRISLSNCVPLCFSSDADFGGGGCTSGFTHCTIGPLGEVRPCTHAEVVIGQMPDDDLEKLWQCQEILEWRNLIPDHCIECAALNSCRGGCRAVAQKLHAPHDPLQRKALKKAKCAVVVELGMNDRPRIACQVNVTDFGVALSGRGHYVTLTHRSRPVLDRLDGNTTVREILSEFGPNSLKLIGGLLQENLLALE